MFYRTDENFLKEVALLTLVSANVILDCQRRDFPVHYVIGQYVSVLKEVREKIMKNINIKIK